MVYDPNERSYFESEQCTKQFYDKEVWREIRSIRDPEHDTRWFELVRYFDWYHGFNDDYCAWKCYPEYDCAADNQLDYCKINYCYE